MKSVPCYFGLQLNVARQKKKSSREIVSEFWSKPITLKARLLKVSKEQFADEFRDFWLFTLKTVVFLAHLKSFFFFFFQKFINMLFVQSNNSFLESS